MVAFTFYGNPELVHHNTSYFKGILANIEAISALYGSSWSMRLYHDIALDNPWMAELCKLACSYDLLDLCPVNKLPLPLLTNAGHMLPTLWRFFPTLDPQVDIFLSRDLDSTISSREVEAVDEWLKSEKTLHVMRDHPLHSVPMLAGLWGTKLMNSRDAWKSIWTAIMADPQSRSSREGKGHDQTLLSRHVWGKLYGGVMQHDNYWCTQWPDGSLGFPSQRPNSTENFVGGYRGYRKPVWLECPKECRRLQSWIYC